MAARPYPGPERRYYDPPEQEQLAGKAVRKHTAAFTNSRKEETMSFENITYDVTHLNAVRM
jgi:hypothetical protein